MLHQRKGPPWRSAAEFLVGSKGSACQKCIPLGRSDFVFLFCRRRTFFSSSPPPPPLFLFTDSTRSHNTQEELNDVKLFIPINMTIITEDVLYFNPP